MYNIPSPRGCVGVRIGTIPALIVEGDYQGHPLESRGIKIWPTCPLEEKENRGPVLRKCHALCTLKIPRQSSLRGGHWAPASAKFSDPTQHSSQKSLPMLTHSVTRFSVLYSEAGQEFRVVFALMLILSGNFKYKNISLALLGGCTPISLKSSILHPNGLDKIIARIL